MSSEQPHHMIDHAWRDEAGRRHCTEPLECACGWRASTTDGWNSLSQWYDHLAAIYAPGVVWP